MFVIYMLSQGKTGEAEYTRRAVMIFAALLVGLLLSSDLSAFFWPNI